MAGLISTIPFYANYLIILTLKVNIFDRSKNSKIYTKFFFEYP
jgi:hypothetical protein